MPVIPEFNPGQAQIEGPSVAGTVSFMQRAAQSRLMQEQMHQEIEQKRIQFEIQRPVMEAQQQAALVGSAANLVLQKQAADFVAQQTNSLPALQDEWHSLNSIPDPQERLLKQNQFLNRVAPISMLPAGKDLYASWSHGYDQQATLQKQNDVMAEKDLTRQVREQNEAAKREIEAFRATAAAQARDADFEIKRLKADNDRLAKEREDETKRRGQDLSGQNRIAKDKDQLRNKALTDIATQRENLGQMGYAIDQMATDLKAEQSSLLGSGPFVGSDTVATVRAAAGDPSARQVQQDIGDFANRIMSTVKNIRNIQEFRAVTAMIPRASDPAAVQNRKLQKLQEVNQTLIQRNDYREQLMRDNPDVDSTEAERLAAERFPFALASPASAPAGGLTPDEQKRLQELRAKLGK